MAGVNNLNIYAPVKQAAGGQSKDSGVKNQPDKTEDSFGKVMKDTVKSKDNEDGRTKESTQTSEKNPDKKPVEEQSSELKPGEAVPLADLGLMQAMGEAAVPVQSIISETVTVQPMGTAAPVVTVPPTAAQPVVAQENQSSPQDGADLPAAAGPQNSNPLAEAGLAANQEGKVPVAIPQTGSTEVPAEILPPTQTVSAEVPVTTVQSEAQSTVPVIAKQQVPLTETAGREVQTGKELPAGKEAPAGEIKQSSHVQSTEIRPEQAAEVKAEPVAYEAKQTTEAGQVKETETLDIHMLQQMMKEPAAVLPQTEEVVHIKVAEPFNRADENLVKQLGDKTAQGLLDGKRELTIQLDPEHLGKISIKISVMNEGVRVQLSCDNQKTLGLLAERSDGIGHIIENNMKSPVVVEVKEDNYWSQQKNATDQHTNHNGRQQEESKENKADDSDVFLQQMRLGLLEERLVV